MLKIRALNRESSSDEDFPVIRREAQEEIALEEYNKALRLQAAGDLTESETILMKLIEENIPLLENNGGLPKSMSTLKYSCFVNVGNIYLQRQEINKALDKFTIASELDTTDVTLWYKIGKLALKVDKFRQSAYAFSKGLECSESHWPCLDQLISVLYAIKDTVGCLEYIGKALMLDSDYTKGLVLRRQIYRDNPATKEYYQIYNSDYIWEPPLDVPVDEEDEQKFLNEAQILSDRIRDVEKSVGPKPLLTIPLPKPLENFTWVSLAKTIIYLHQYITDNEMTHFTMVDVNRCMSQNLEVPVVVAEVEPVEETVASEKLEETKIVEGPADVVEEEKMDVESIPERRSSQNSDNNNDVQENTPVQTDNDEEPPLEQENEEQDENSQSKNDKSRPRSTKRRRDLVSELQIWGWHSKRKYAKKGKQDKDFSVEDAFNRIIPKNLLKSKLTSEKITQMEDSMNTMDLYNMYVEDRDINFLSPIHSPKSVNYEPYFGTDREKEDVQQFWTKKRDYCDAVVLIKDLVFTLSKLWHLKWPKELVPMYIEAYNMFREHCDPPEIFSEEVSFEEIRDYALATLLYGELLSFSLDGKESIHATLLNFLLMISGWVDYWKEECHVFFNRVHWLRTHIFIKENNNDLAIRSLQLVQEIIVEEETKLGDKYFLSLPNCFKCGLITNQITEKILKHLDLVTSLSNLEELFNAEKYVDVADVLKLTFNNTGNHPQVGKMGRPAQLELLLHSLWFTNMSECFIWTEKCLYESLEHILKPSKDTDKWEKIVEKCLGIFHEIIKMETVSVVDALSEDKRSRLVESLIKIIRKQLSDNASNIPLSCVTPWILLHYILVREEHRQQANKRVSHIKTDKTETVADLPPENKEDELPPSVSILFSAHDFLGPKGWCVIGHGELLHFILDTVLDRLDTPIFELLREKIDIHIEQALFCLYQHPSKKNKVSRHLADHNVDPLPLSWERSFQLYEFYGPDCLPEFNSYKNASISADLEQLLKRIMALVPTSCDPKITVPKIMDFVHGKSDEMPEPMEFPNKVRAIYYLIGDYYFKQREFHRCLKYLQMDLCINPLRLDSWACMGLSYVSELESKLNYCKKIKIESDFLDKAKSAQICFKKALTLSPEHLMLWIEFGSFEYMVHSFCSRLLKYESENFSMERFEFLENQKNSYLDSSGSSFEKAIALYELDENEPDERWLQYYVLGKIAEKKQKEPTEYLQYYVTASTLLRENNATYPEKINYHNPQHLAVEALELHYRIHASVLKYLELHEGKEISNTLGAFFKKCLNTTSFLKKSASKLPAKPADSTSNNTSFQSQFLNSIKAQPITTNGSDVSKIVATDDKKLEDEGFVRDVRKCLDDLLAKVEEIEKECQKADENNVQEIKQEIKTEINEEVIMISDSDDEKDRKERTPKTVASEMPAKDVQTRLDELMLETMKGIEDPIDSDVSFTEVKEYVKPKEVVEEVKMEMEKVEEKSKSNKPTDSETDTDNIRTSVDDSSSSSATSSTSSSSSDSDSDSSSSSSSSSSDNENMSSNEIILLVDRCIAGLEICITRLPQNYKALYRLAHLYFNYKAKKDYAKCKQLLLGEYKCKDGGLISGLFSDRKINNFFNGIWRIPSSEIDRPGSLSAHMSRCVSLLLQILRAINDNKTLMELSVQLRKSPDPDKIYIKESERMQFADQAMTMCTQSFRAQIKNVPNMSNPEIVKLLQEIFKVYQKVQKYVPAKENNFSTLLTDVYKQFIKEKIPENVNVLDLATKFCQQNRPIDKPKPSPVQNQQPPVPRGPSGPSFLSPPVHPSPSAIIAPSQNIPLKRPGAGRPRGRPPLPKIPGQPRIPRGRSTPTNSYSWRKPLYDQNYVYEYFKHYQEQLIKQYSQQLSIPQLTQLTQLFAQNQFSTHLAGDPLSNKFLASQGGMLTPPSSSLLKPMSSGGGGGSSSSSSSMTASSQMLENMNQPNPSLIKKLAAEHGLASLGSSAADQLMFYSSLLPSTSKNIIPHTSKSNMPHSLSQPSTSKKPKLAHSMPKSIPSTSAKYSAIESAKLKANAMTKTSSQIFKEPAFTKMHKVVTAQIPGVDVDKNTNILMKDRPSISITPVTGTVVTTITTTSAFAKPVSTSPGKTLQEKLADKQKQQLNKHLKKNIESEMFAKDVAMSSASLMKSLNLSTIPSSLTVSKAILPSSSSSTSSFSMDSIRPPSLSVSKALSTSSSKYPMDLGLSTSLSVSKPSMTIPTSKFSKEVSLASSLIVSKPSSSATPKFSMETKLPASLSVLKSAVPVPTPTFPLESGISISQVPVIQHVRPTDKLAVLPRKELTSNVQQRKPPQALSIDASVSKKEKAIPKPHSNTIPKNIQRTLGSVELSKKAFDFMQMYPSQMSLDQLTSLTGIKTQELLRSTAKSSYISPSKDKLPSKGNSNAPVSIVRKNFPAAAPFASTSKKDTSSSSVHLVRKDPVLSAVFQRKNSEITLLPTTSKKINAPPTLSKEPMMSTLRREPPPYKQPLKPPVLEKIVPLERKSSSSDDDVICLD